MLLMGLSILCRKINHKILNFDLLRLWFCVRKLIKYHQNKNNSDMFSISTDLKTR